MSQLHSFTPPPLPPPKPKPLLLPPLPYSKAPPPPPPRAPPLFYSLTNWADDLKELGVRKRRPLYTPNDWRIHRSSARHLRHLLTSLTSRVILSLVPPVAAFTAVAAALTVYNSAVAAQWLPLWFPLLHASSLPYQLTAPALALLLVFRTEASYSRFEEGRKAWVKVVAGAAELAGMVMAGTEADVGVRRALMNYILAFPVALKVVENFEFCFRVLDFDMVTCRN